MDTTGKFGSLAFVLLIHLPFCWVAVAFSERQGVLVSTDAATTARSWLRSVIDRSQSVRLPSPPDIRPRQGRFGW